MPHKAPSVLIVGAGAIGVALGYHVQLAGANVCFLVRPHRAEDLQHPQVLYCHDDNSLKTFQGYDYITSASELLVREDDYIFLTLDGAALKSDSGRDLVAIISKLAEIPGNTTKIVIGTFHFDIRTWFLDLSGLRENRVASCNAAIHAYSTRSFRMPATVDDPVSAKLVEQADWAYADRFSTGAAFHLMDDCPEIAKSFSELYNACGVSKCIIRSPTEDAVFGNVAPVAFAATELLGWPKFRDIDPNSDIWSLATGAAKEIMELQLHGQYGALAAGSLEPSTFLEGMKHYEATFGTFDIIAFSRYHHGGKVLSQDRQHLEDCIAQGEKEGKAMKAVRILLQRVTNTDDST